MGLAYGLGIDTVPINTLEAIAWNMGEPGTLICPVIDARRQEAYTALYRLTMGIPEIVHEPTALPVAGLSSLIAEMDETCTITGPAVTVFRASLENTISTPLTFIEGDDRLPSALSIARLGLLHAERGERIPSSELEPVYLRRSDAEIARASQCGSR